MKRGVWTFSCPPSCKVVWYIIMTALGLQRSDFLWIIDSYYLAFGQQEGWVQGRSLRERTETGALEAGVWAKSVPIWQALIEHVPGPGEDTERVWVLSNPSQRWQPKPSVCQYRTWILYCVKYLRGHTHLRKTGQHKEFLPSVDLEQQKSYVLWETWKCVIFHHT